MTSAWAKKNMAFLGKQVEILLDDEGPVIVKGKLLSFSDEGEFVIQDEAGDCHYCWPMLKIRDVA